MNHSDPSEFAKVTAAGPPSSAMEGSTKPEAAGWIFLLLKAGNWTSSVVEKGWKCEICEMFPLFLAWFLLKDDVKCGSL